MNVQLLIVDPQNDFVVADDGHGHHGSLVVKGAVDDMARVAAMIKRIGPKLDDIHVTMDSHQTIGIERPRWWVRVSDRSHAAPYTVLGIHPDGKRIVKVEFPAGAPVFTDEEYTTYIPSFLHKGGPTGAGSFGYLQAIMAKGLFHVVWPEHCRVGSWGWAVVEELEDALHQWEWDQFGRVVYVVKGNNPWTEHYGAVCAEVPDPADPSTQVNTDFVTTLAKADIIAITGEALSHCVNATGRGIVTNFADPRYIEKIVLLTDATSNVPGFEFLGEALMTEMLAKGMKTSTTMEFLA